MTRCIELARTGVISEDGGDACTADSRKEMTSVLLRPAPVAAPTAAAAPAKKPFGLGGMFGGRKGDDR